MIDGKYSFTASASSFADVSWQVKTFRDDPMTLKVLVETASDSGAGRESKDESAKLETATAEEIAAAKFGRLLAAQNKVGFSIVLEVNPKIFNK